MKDKVNIPATLARLTEFWSQGTVAQANGQLFKVAKGIGSTRWHQHDDQDELFIIYSGQLTIQLRDRDVELGAGDIFVVPRGVEHCPKADIETQFLIVGLNITSNAAGGKPEASRMAEGQT
ncbi:cupin domain-containing protein [Massilia sp. IC2-477]|uniref:cupin domain-containing protein n=1 Tax=Massilia sp. IC2-477 TaxID=2887198 RepID=UPI001D11592D|nr:cupin domain-containing protein [Massilia sp. IC2-477]MCC2955950.1 cupin domain-containing protein [Massilia sp. IC2-477]